MGQALHCLPGEIGARPAVGAPIKTRSHLPVRGGFAASPGPPRDTPRAAKLTIFASYC